MAFLMIWGGDVRIFQKLCVHLAESGYAALQSWGM